VTEVMTENNLNDAYKFRYVCI